MKEREDSFFATTAFELIKVLHAIAKETCYPDLIMVQALLYLPQLVQRLSLAEKQKCLKLWIAANPPKFSFCQTNSSTSLGIVITACQYLDSLLIVNPNYQHLSQADWLIEFKLRTSLAEALLPIGSSSAP